MSENNKHKHTQDKDRVDKRVVKLFSIAGGLSARESAKEQAADGLSILAYMMGIYNRELKSNRVPWSLRHKLCVELLLELMRGADNG